MPFSPAVEVAVQTLYHSLREKDRRRYAAVEAAKLGHGGVEYCNGGGSNSSSRYLFKEGLQNLAERLGFEIRVAHYPPYTSKYNPIEHRLFPHVTRACQGIAMVTSFRRGNSYPDRNSVGSTRRANARISFQSSDSSTSSKANSFSRPANSDGAVDSTPRAI